MQLASTKLGEEGNVQGSRQGLKLERRLCVTPHEAPLMTKSCTLGFLRSHQRGPCGGASCVCSAGISRN